MWLVLRPDKWNGDSHLAWRWHPDELARMRQADQLEFKSKSVKFTLHFAFFDSIQNFRRRSFGKTERTGGF